jgi:hypothetical protein
MSTRLEAVVRRFARDRHAAHAVLFAHRHPQASAPFHLEMIDDWHSSQRLVVEEAFRDAAKSTIGEEAVILRAGFREFKNALIVGSTGPRAAERLESIKHEIEVNEEFREVFGDLKGPVWAVHTAQIGNDAVIQALGVGQSLRGVKFHQWRPDFCWIDDIEDEDSVKTPDARLERLDWLYGTLLPALAKDALVRMTGNRLDEGAVIAEVAKDEDWHARRFPIRYRDERGAWRASWPEMFDLKWIDESRAAYARRGLLGTWDREYMCEADGTHEQKPFKPDFWKLRPRARTWQATYAMYDPARTVGAASATTAKAVWSWVGSKLVVWDGWAKKIMPSEIIADLFEVDRKFQPVLLGVEEDGLNEWLRQPIRAEIAKRGHGLPNLKPVKAPPGKLDFIRGLEPFAAAGEIEFAFEDAALRAQFLNFPKPPIDFPNALAYALKLRPGLPIYDEFSEAHIIEDLAMMPHKPLWLAINAGAGHVTAVLLQFADGIRVLADWIEEGDPGLAAPLIWKEANMFARGDVPTCVGEPRHFEQWGNVGMRQALRRVGAELRKGVDWKLGREEIRAYFRRQHRGLPCVRISSRARWTCNAFAGGYAMGLPKGGLLTERAEPGIYRTLMEGVESYAGLLRNAPAEQDDEESGVRYATTSDGRRYVCAMPGRQ